MSIFVTHRSTSAGFTLIEMLVVIAITVIISAVVMNTIINFYRYNDYTVAQTNELREARNGLQLMIRDLREMTFADNGQFPLVATASTSVVFFSDVDRDDSVELIAYDLAGTTLQKYVYNAAGVTYSTTTPDDTIVLSEYVQNSLEATPIFRYYDTSGVEATATTSISDIRYITVDLIVNVDPIRNPGEFTLRSSAALRNIIETY
jgi:prepilin-type N-terminal cleavage/methylation domain-containing protein